RVGGVVMASPLARVRCVSETDPVPTPAIHLENAAGRCRADESEIVVRRGIHVASAVEAAPNIRESERADQPLSHTVALQRGEGSIFGRDLTAVQKFESSDLQHVSLVPPETRVEL